MKKLYLFAVLILCCFSGLSHAQSTLSYGFKGGLNLGNAEARAFADGLNLELDSRFRPSLYAGAFMEFSLENLSRNLYSQLELQYVSSGSKVKASALTPEVTHKLDQLNIPFIFKYRIADPLFITGGLYWGVIIHAEEEYPDGDSFDTTEEHETFDSGLLIGAEVPLGEKLFLELRYNLGLLDILKFPEGEETSGSYKNRFVQLGVGIEL